MSYVREFGISVLIPSYNHKEFLLRAIDSVVKQDFRPIQIIVADDSTNSDLLTTPEIRNLEKKYNVQIDYDRNALNLGFFRNFRNALTRIKFQYYVLLLHDDYYVDFSFFSRAIEELSNSSRLSGCYISNSEDEETGLNLMEDLQNEIKVISGRKMVLGLWSKYHSNHSAIIFDFRLLEYLNYQAVLVDDNTLDKFRMSADEGFISILLIERQSNFLIENRPVVVRGHNSSSWSRSQYWAQNMSHCMLLTYFYFLQKVGKARLLTRFSIYWNLFYKYPISEFNIDFFSLISGFTQKLIYCLCFIHGVTIRINSKILYELKKLSFT